jgi:hypothetical protein
MTAFFVNTLEKEIRDKKLVPVWSKLPTSQRSEWLTAMVLTALAKPESVKEGADGRRTANTTARRGEGFPSQFGTHLAIAYAISAELALAVLPAFLARADEMQNEGIEAYQIAGYWKGDDESPPQSVNKQRSKMREAEEKLSRLLSSRFYRGKL